MRRIKQKEHGAMIANFPPFDYTDTARLDAELTKALPGHYRLVFDLVTQVAAQNNFKLYLVGGIVRDLFLGRPNFDLDFVCLRDTYNLAHLLTNAFENLLEIKTVKLTEHQAFGTVRLDLNFMDNSTIHVDIATARLETYAHPAALPTVHFPATIEEDLRRRDFNINAVAIALPANPDETLRLFDIFNGISDMRDGWLRVLHALSFEDDPTRILRGVRFAARFGYRFEPGTSRLLQDALAAHYLQRLSPERIRNELTLILQEARPEKAMQILADLGILAEINSLLVWKPELAAEFQQIRNTINPKPDPAFYLAILTCQLEPNRASQLVESLKFSGLRKQLPIEISELWQNLLPQLQQSENMANSRLYALLHSFKPESLQLFTMLLDKYGYGKIADQVRFYQAVLAGKKPQLGGDYLKQAGLKPGPQFRLLLDELRDAVLDGELTNRQDEEEFLQKKIAELS